MRTSSVCSARTGDDITMINKIELVVIKTGFISGRILIQPVAQMRDAK